MMAKIDKYLVEEFKERGYDFDYKQLVEIYRASRNRQDCIKQKERNLRDNILISNMMMEVD